MRLLQGLQYMILNGTFFLCLVQFQSQNFCLLIHLKGTDKSLILHLSSNHTNLIT